MQRAGCSPRWDSSCSTRRDGWTSPTSTSRAPGRWSTASWRAASARPASRPAPVRPPPRSPSPATQPSTCTCTSTSGRARSSRSGARSRRAPPVAIACTSGTAAAEFLPAVVEASQSRVPIVVLTADRPPRLRGTGANQTIDQVGLYGPYVRGTSTCRCPRRPARKPWWRQAAREALEATRGDPVGPVHVNCPFEEPLSLVGRRRAPPSDRRGARPAEPTEADLTVEEADRLAELVSGARGAVVIGGWPGDVSASAASGTRCSAGRCSPSRPQVRGCRSAPSRRGRP